MTRCLCLNGINIGLLATRKVGALQLYLSCIHTYIQHTYIPTVLPSRSFTTSFVFPSFSDPATTFETHYWKKLTCGVIRSFNSGTKKHGEIISCSNYQMAMNLCPPISDIYIYSIYVFKYSYCWLYIPILSNLFRYIPFMFLVIISRSSCLDPIPKPNHSHYILLIPSSNCQYCISHVRPMSYNYQKSMGKLPNCFSQQMYYSQSNEKYLIFSIKFV